MILLLHQHHLITGLSQPRGWGSAITIMSTRMKFWEGKSGVVNQLGEQGRNLQPSTLGGEWRPHTPLELKSWKSKLFQCFLEAWKEEAGFIVWVNFGLLFGTSRLGLCLALFIEPDALRLYDRAPRILKYFTSNYSQQYVETYRSLLLLCESHPWKHTLVFR